MDAPVESLGVVLARISQFVENCNDAQFLDATRCAGWSVQDLLFHILLDAQRGLVALAQPVDAPADTDDVTYWLKRSTQDEQGLRTRHARFVRRAAMAYAEPQGLVTQWKDTSAAVVAALSGADPRACVQTQVHVLAVEHFCSTLVVEAALHLLDLEPDATDWGLPEAITSSVRDTLEALLGEPAPSDWDDRTTALVLAGRKPLSDPMPFADRLPVIH